MTAILKKMIDWSKEHMHATIGADFIRVLNYTLLAHYLSANKYDIDLFREYVKNPTDCHTEFNDKARKR